MKKSLFLVTAGVAGMLLCSPQDNANAEVGLHISIGGAPYYGYDRYPDFIFLDDYGFSVSWGWDYDLIWFDNYYFIYRDGGWFRSLSYRGPWAPVRYWNLPYQIRRHDWNDIRRRRDREYRKHDRNFWNRHFEEQRIRDRRDDRDRRPDGRPDFRPDAGRPDGRPDFRPDGGRPDGRPDFRPDGGRPDGKPDFRPDGGRPDGKPDFRPDGGRPDGRPDFRPDGGRPDGRPDFRPDGGRPDGRPDFGPQPQGRPDQRPQPQAQPQGRPDQRPEPQVQPQGRPDQRPQKIFDRFNKSDDGQRKDNPDSDRRDRDGRPDGRP